MTPRAMMMLPLMLCIGGRALGDPRVTTRLYQPNTIVLVHGRVGIESTIVFAPEEHIENIAVGDSSQWEVIPNRRADLIFFKPATPSAHTNMTVVTDQRTYLFDLVSSSERPAYMLRFTYPPAPDPIVRVSAAETTIVPPPPPPKAAEADPAALNFDWDVHGDKKLLPARLFDDGHDTYLSWSQDAALPAILLREPSGAEGPVNYTVKGSYIVVEGVPEQLVLRSGKEVATLTTKPHAPAAAATSDQSSIPESKTARQPMGDDPARLDPAPSVSTLKPLVASDQR